MKNLKYTHYDIVFQEVPNEITLVFNISGCPHKCEGCHSQYLWEDIGYYLSDDIDRIINEYTGMITCVCFMGGDQNMPELSSLLIMIKDKYHLKACIYSGSNDLQIFKNILQYLDFIKIGSYIDDLGGLNKVTTNQKFYRIENNILIDITEIFQNKF